MTFISPIAASPVAVPRNDFIAVLRRLGLSDNLKLCLDAGSEASWPGSGQKFLDLSGGGFDFFLGADGTATTNDPTFNGTVGLRTGSEYFSVDGGDRFTYDSANETWMADLHKDGSAITFASWWQIPSDSSTYVFSTQNAHGLLWGYSGSQNTHQLLLRTPTATDIVVASSAAGAPNISSPLPKLFFMAFSGVNTSGGPFTLHINGVTYTGTYPVATISTTDAGNTLRMMVSNSAGAAAPSGTRLYQVAAWFGKVLTAAEMNAIWAATRGKHGI
jgi:hypothetical protein